MQNENFTEITPQKLFLTIMDNLDPAKCEIYLSRKCVSLLKNDDKDLFVKILGNSKSIKLKVEKCKSADNLKVTLTGSNCGKISKCNRVLSKLKNIGWIFRENRKFEGTQTDDGFIFSRDKMLKVVGS